MLQAAEAYGTAYKPRGDYNESFQNVRQDNFDIFVGGEKKFGLKFLWIIWQEAPNPEHTTKQKEAVETTW
jgi:hypothetical protein